MDPELVGEIIGYTILAWAFSKLLSARFQRIKSFLNHVLLGEVVLVALVIAVMLIQVGILRWRGR